MVDSCEGIVATRLPNDDNRVRASINRSCFKSTNKLKYFKKSEPKIGRETSAIINFHSKSRRRPRSSDKR